MAVQRKCWRYTRLGCRNEATAYRRYGDVIVHACEEHDPGEQSGDER